MPHRNSQNPDHAGQAFHCDGCGQNSLLKAKPRLDGWTQVGTDLVCALCGAVVSCPGQDDEPVPSESAELAAAARFGDALAFLGTDETEARPDAAEFLDQTDAPRFCKDCTHFIRHPFVTRCGLHDRDTHPTSDCPDFAPRPAGEDASLEQ